MKIHFKFTYVSENCDYFSCIIFLKVTQKLHESYTENSLTVTQWSDIIYMLITVSAKRKPLSSTMAVFLFSDSVGTGEEQRIAA